MLSHLVPQGCREGCTCIPWGPSLSSSPHLYSSQDMGTSLCPPEMVPHIAPTLVRLKCV